MQYLSLDDLTKVAHVLPAKSQPPWARRRERLRRLADLLDDKDTTVDLFWRSELAACKSWENLRKDRSVFALASQDCVFRKQGLAGDRLGDAAAFFGLSRRHIIQVASNDYVSATSTSKVTARQVRSLANRLTASEISDCFANILKPLRQTISKRFVGSHKRGGGLNQFLSTELDLANGTLNGPSATRLDDRAHCSRTGAPKDFSASSSTRNTRAPK